MLEYDEWAVPGEVEYAGKKAAEIEARLQKHHNDLKNDRGCRNAYMCIQITEHVIGRFAVTLSWSVWNPPADIFPSNEMMLDWYRDTMMAYPVMKEVQVAETSREYHYYDKERKQFDWEDFSRIRKTWE